MNLPKPPRLRFLLAGTVWLMGMLAGARGGSGPPPAPAGMILDQAHVLLPERATWLSQRLRAAAEERSIRVYVVTLQSLGVAPSVQKERLANLAHFYSDAWLGKSVGVMLLVDDESGAAIIVATDETNRVYPPFQRNILLDEPLRLVQRETLLRDKVEQTALAIVEVLRRLQDEDRAKERRERTVNRVFAGWMTALALGGTLLFLVIQRARARRGKKVTA